MIAPSCSLWLWLSLAKTRSSRKHSAFRVRTPEPAARRSGLQALSQHPAVFQVPADSEEHPCVAFLPVVISHELDPV